MKNLDSKKDFYLSQILRIASTLVPDKRWVTLRIEGYIVGSITEVKSWYTVPDKDSIIEFDNFDLEYINQDQDNNSIDNFITKLRELTYDSVKGAWFTVIIDYNKDGTGPVLNYNYDEMPPFSHTVPLNLYRKDLQIYPRAADYMPQWA